MPSADTTVSPRWLQGIVTTDSPIISSDVLDNHTFVVSRVVAEALTG
jgi:hypothetical protein